MNQSALSQRHDTHSALNGLHQHYVQQNCLHGIESAISAEILVVDDPKVYCKEDCKAASREGSQSEMPEDAANKMHQWTFLLTICMVLQLT